MLIVKLMVMITMMRMEIKMTIQMILKNKKKKKILNKMRIQMPKEIIMTITNQDQDSQI